MDLTDLVLAINKHEDTKCDHCGNTIGLYSVYCYSEWELLGGASHPNYWFNFCRDCVARYRGIKDE